MKTESEITWEGDLADDCTAYWNGLILRAEKMDSYFWGWAISINDNNVIEEIDSANNYEAQCIGGVAARAFAEKAAIQFTNKNTKH